MSAVSSTTELLELGAPIALDVGSCVTVRELHATDRLLLLRAF